MAEPTLGTCIYNILWKNRIGIKTVAPIRFMRCRSTPPPPINYLPIPSPSILKFLPNAVIAENLIRRAIL